MIEILIGMGLGVICTLAFMWLYIFGMYLGWWR